MAGKLAANRLIETRFVGDQARILRNMLMNDIADRVRRDVADKDYRRCATSGAVNERDNLVHVVDWGARGTGHAPDIGFINLHIATVAAHRAIIAGDHGFMDAMRHEPGRLIGDAQVAA